MRFIWAPTIKGRFWSREGLCLCQLRLEMDSCHGVARANAKYAQYKGELPDFGVDSTPALIIIALERHGSWS